MDKSYRKLRNNNSINRINTLNAKLNRINRNSFERSNSSTRIQATLLDFIICFDYNISFFTKKIHKNVFFIEHNLFFNA